MTDGRNLGISDDVNIVVERVIATPRAGIESGRGEIFFFNPPLRTKNIKQVKHPMAYVSVENGRSEVSGARIALSLDAKQKGCLKRM